MTAGFALLLAGWLLLESGWKGTTPDVVLKGLVSDQPGAGGVLGAAGQAMLASFTPGGGVGNGGMPTPRLGGGHLEAKNQKHKEKALSTQHPELKAGIRAVTAIILIRFPGLSITSTTGGTHATDSLHYEGRAVDLYGSPEEMNKAAKWINKYIGDVLAEGIHNPGLSIDNGKRVPSSFWGSETWNAHTDHIHVAA